MTEINRKVVKRDRVDTGQFFRIFIIYTPKIALYEKKYKKNTTRMGGDFFQNLEGPDLGFPSRTRKYLCS